ncbi:GNAT family N-acetyltransferase [Streptomyces sp. CB01881]|uniref:GNAT family N-acetyltransferase n=1 Tax=Streptomyces sp. CB01881 TaxID=2078691 RepID=UPI000CDC5AA4|nr:GNAT family N-acetyltransferase [Streptomyces sp. CB01881]AUY52594.1 GNAT family N-acetyltransferase [Streptomyces sp. CB01881]TYC70313.1 GNAT family N-acetyltransferase [Streptomyces sp. CB01881]
MNRQSHGGYDIRHATTGDLDGARSLILDTFYREFGYGYVPRWHADVIDLRSTYLDHPRHTLVVAVHRGEVVGTTALNSSGPAHPPHPRLLAERYPAGSTAQLLRVYVRATHRRNGLARRMVDLACAFAADVGGYRSIYLHTNTDVPGAEPFWRQMAEEVFDARPTGEHGRGVSTVHFEIPMPPAPVSAHAAA